MHESFSTLFDFLPIGAYRTSADGRQLRANRALAALNGFETEAEQVAAFNAGGTPWYVQPGRRDEFLHRLERDGYVVGFVSEVMRRRTGECIWVSENAHVVRDAAGRVDYHEGTIEDVTARVRQEALLRDSERRWRQALDSSGDGVWEWNIAEGTETFSPGFAQLYGFTTEELLALAEPFVSRLHPDDDARRRRLLDEHLAGRTPRYVSEHRFRCKDGHWKWVQVRGMVIERDAAGQPLRMVVTHTDMTSAKDAEALRRARDLAESADRAKTELLSHVSHELRTPLNGVLGFAQLLEQAPDLPPHFRPWVGRILDSGRHLVGVVDDLLDLSSAQGGGLRLTLQPVEPGALLQDTWTMLAQRAQDAGVRLVARWLTGREHTVMADRLRLRQVMTNLLSNAVKYNRPGGQVEVATERSGAQVALRITDTGQGMDASQLERIFRPFERLGAESTAIPGTGLGLALSQQLVARMGGRIDVQSTPGHGTTFTVLLRAAHEA